MNPKIAELVNGYGKMAETLRRRCFWLGCLAALNFGLAFINTILAWADSDWWRMSLVCLSLGAGLYYPYTWRKVARERRLLVQLQIDTMRFDSARTISAMILYLDQIDTTFQKLLRKS